MLFVTGTGWIVLSLCTARTSEQLRDQALTFCNTQADQMVESLGLELLDDDAKSASKRNRVRGTLHRMLKGGSGPSAIYSVIHQDGRVVIVHEARRSGDPRAYGTPVALSNAGYRANRTHVVQSSVIKLDDQDVIQTFAPILDDNHQVLGLLVMETPLASSLLVGTNVWTAFGLALLAGLVALTILTIRIAKPLERMQDQLVAKHNLSPKLIRRPADLLREITRIIDKAHADRDYFSAMFKQQDRQKESSMRRKDEVIANTVHELRTPLTSIIASLEIMLDNDDMMTPEEKQEFMAQATTAARHMMFVVNDMLDAAAIEAGQINMQIEECGLRQMLSDAKRSMELVATSRAMALVVDDVDPTIRVRADSARLMQVIFNLVSNAVKYTPAGSTVTLRAWPSLKSVIIEVEDEGESIPVEMRAKLFTRFSKLEREDEPHIKSSGIGLFLSKKLVELMHGTIGYRESETTQGSVFWFTLPLVVDEAMLPVVEI